MFLVVAGHRATSIHQLPTTRFHFVRILQLIGEIDSSKYAGQHQRREYNRHNLLHFTVLPHSGYFATVKLRIYSVGRPKLLFGC